MAERFRKRTTDHDGDGEKGGSLPGHAALVERVRRLEEAVGLGDPVAAASHLKG